MCVLCVCEYEGIRVCVSVKVYMSVCVCESVYIHYTLTVYVSTECSELHVSMKVYECVCERESVATRTL